MKRLATLVFIIILMIPLIQNVSSVAIKSQAVLNEKSLKWAFLTGGKIIKVEKITEYGTENDVVFKTRDYVAGSGTSLNDLINTINYDLRYFGDRQAMTVVISYKAKFIKVVADNGWMYDDNGNEVTESWVPFKLEADDFDSLLGARDGYIIVETKQFVATYEYKAVKITVSVSWTAESIEDTNIVYVRILDADGNELASNSADITAESVSTTYEDATGYTSNFKVQIELRDKTENNFDNSVKARIRVTSVSIIVRYKCKTYLQLYSTIELNTAKFICNLDDTIQTADYYTYFTYLVKQIIIEKQWDIGTPYYIDSNGIKQYFSWSSATNSWLTSWGIDTEEVPTVYAPSGWSFSVTTESGILVKDSGERVKNRDDRIFGVSPATPDVSNSIDFRVGYYIDTGSTGYAEYGVYPLDGDRIANRPTDSVPFKDNNGNIYAPPDWEGTIYIAMWSDVCWKIVKITNIVHDEESPTLSVSYPTDWVKGTIYVYYDVSDESYVQRVWIEHDGNVIDENTYSNQDTVSDNFPIDTTQFQDGSITLYVKAEDWFGYVKSVPITIYVDNSPVEISFDTSTVYQNTTTIKVTFSVKSKGSDIHWEIYINDVRVDSGTAIADGTWKTISKQYTYPEGEYSIYIKYWDATHSPVTTGTKKVIIDTTKPSVKITQPANNSYITTSSITITWDITDSYLDSAKVYIDGVWKRTYVYGVNWSTTLSWNFAEGDHEIKIIAYDKARNMNYQKIIIHVDLHDPIARFDDYPSNYSEELYVNITCTDLYFDYAKLIYNTGSGNFTYATYTNPKTNYHIDLNTIIPSDFQGQVTIYLDVYDEAGRYTSIKITIIIDRILGTITTTVPSGWISGTHAISASWNTDEKYPDHMELYIDNKLITQGNSINYNWDTTLWPDGEHLISIKYIDKAGHYKWQNTTVYVDNTPIEIIFDTSTIYKNSSVIVVMFYLNSTGSTIYWEIYINETLKDSGTAEANGTWQLINRSFVYPEGVYIITIKYRDETHDPPSNPPQKIVVIDQTQPTITVISAPEDNTWISGTIYIEFTASDNYLDQTYMIIDNTKYDTTSKYIDTTQWKDGHKLNITLVAIDKAGNRKEVVLSYKIDNSPVKISFDTSTMYQNSTTIIVTFYLNSTGSTIYWEIYINNIKVANGTTIADGTWKTITKQFPDYAEGEYSIYIKYWDATHSLQTTGTKKVIIDLTKPSIGNAEWAHGIWGPNNESSTTWTQLLYGDWVTDAEHEGVTIRVEVTDNYEIDTIALSLIGKQSGNVTPSIIGYIYDGTYLYVWLETQNIWDGDTLTLSVVTSDLAGNSNSKDYVFRLDNALPSLQTTNYLFDYGYYYQSVYYYGGEYPIVNITAVITDSGDNLVYINVSLRSSTEEIWIIEFTWSGIEWSYNTLNQKVISVRVDGNQSWVRISIKVNITSIAEGNYEAKIYAKDAAGYENSWSNNVRIDWTPPRNLRIWLESYDVDNPSEWKGNYSIICGQWYFYYSVEDYYDFEIVIKENYTGTILPTPTNGSIWDLTEPAIRSGIFIITFSAWDEVRNKAVVKYIIAVEHNDPYPLLNNTKSGGSIYASGEFVLIISLDIASTHVSGQGWPTGLKWFVVYLDDEVLLNRSFGTPNDYWDRYYSPDGWYNISIILNETYLTPGSHIIKVVTQGMSYWDTEWFTYTLNYKPRVRIKLLNESVYWGHVDLYFNVTDIVGRSLDGRLNISIAGELYSISVTNGFAVLSYIYLTPGTYTVDTTYYQGDGLDTNATFVLEVLKHPLTYDYAVSTIAVNRSYWINITSILDALDNTKPSGTLWFEIYWSYTRNGPWFLLHNISYSGTAILIKSAWTINDLNNDGVIDSNDNYVYLRIVVCGWYEREDVVVQKQVLRGKISVDLAETEFYWGTINLEIIVDDSLDMDENGYCTVLFNSTSYTVDIVNGKGYLKLTILEPGEYSVNVTYYGQVEIIKKIFVIKILPHTLSYDLDISTLAINRSYTIEIANVLDNITNFIPNRTLWFEIYWSDSQYGPWCLLHNVTFNGSDVIINAAWTIDTDADIVYLRIIPRGYYSGEVIVSKQLLRGTITISLSNTTFYWGSFTLTIIVDDTLDLDENGYAVVSLLGNNYTVDIVNGRGSLKLTMLEPEEYNMTVTYYGQVEITRKMFTIKIMRHPLYFLFTSSVIAVNRSYTLKIENITDKILNVVPNRTLWFEVYWSPDKVTWYLLHNVTFNGNDIIINSAWTIDAGDKVYIKVVVRGYYEGEVTIEKQLLHGVITISLKNDTFYWGTFTLTIIVDDSIDLDEDGYAIVMFNGTNYTVDIVNGEGNLPLSIGTPGNYSIMIEYHGQVEVIRKTFTIRILKHPIDFDIKVPNALYVSGYYEIQLYDIIDMITGEVPETTYIINVYYTWQVPAPKWIFLYGAVISGTAYKFTGTWNISDLNNDGIINDADYYVYLRFVVVSEKYEGEKVVGPITVKQIPTISMSTEDTLVYSDFATFMIDTNVPRGTFRVYYWDDVEGWVLNATGMLDDQGNAIIKLYVNNVGTVKYKIELEESEHFQAAEKEFAFNAIAETAEIEITGISELRYSDTAYIIIHVIDDDNHPAVGVEVEVKVEVNGSRITIGYGTTNETGYAAIFFTVQLPEGTYRIIVQINSEKYVANEKSMIVSVLKEKITRIDVTINGNTMIVKVIDDENTTVPKIPVILIYNSTIVADGITDYEGKVVFDISSYRGKELIVKIRENKYSETAETTVKVPEKEENELGNVEVGDKWLTLIIGAVIVVAIIGLATRRGSKKTKINNNLVFAQRVLERQANAR